MNHTSLPPAPMPVDVRGVAPLDGASIAARERRAPTSPSTFSWSRYLAAVRRYKWLMLLVLLVALALGTMAARRVKPQYVVHATIWIAPETQRGSTEGGGPMRGDQVLHPAAWPELLTSFAILDKVARQMSLFVTPTDPRDAPLFAGVGAAEHPRPGRYTLSTDAAGRRYVLSREDARLETGLLGDSVGRSIGLRWRPPPELLSRGRDIRFTVVSPRQAALALRDRLTATLPDGSNLLRATLTGTDPQQMNAVLHAVVDAFVADAAALKKRNLIEVTRTLGEQLQVAQRDLRDAEAALQDYRVRTITLPSESHPASSSTQPVVDPVTESYFTAQVAYDSVRRQHVELERTLAGIRNGTLDLSALNALPAVRNGASELQAAFHQLADRQAQLDTARASFTDKHPTVVALASQVKQLRDQVIPHHAAALLAQLELHEQDLRDQVAATARQLRDVPVRTIEEARLRRNVATRETLFGTLETRFEEARLAEASAVPDVSVLDAPVAPEEPSSNRAPFVGMLAALLGLGAAGGLALGLDRVDPRFRYPEQASEELGLEIVGAVPAARPGDLGNPRDAMQLVEAFRTIRLNLWQAADAAGRLLLTLTSPNAGDGKSMIAANLAQSFADAGHRTLLLDGDIRRGELDRRFETERAPGLLDYLDGTATLEQVLRSTSTERLWLMPRGAPQARGPELLTSPVVPEMMTELRRRFEVVIVDTSPLGAGIDPFVLGAATGNVLLVLRAGESNRKVAEAKLKLLTRLPVRVLGVVLNNVRIGGDFQYYSYAYQDGNEEAKQLPVLESKLTEFARRSGLQ